MPNSGRNAVLALSCMLAACGRIYTPGSVATPFRPLDPSTQAPATLVGVGPAIDIHQMDTGATWKPKIATRVLRLPPGKYEITTVTPTTWKAAPGATIQRDSKNPYLGRLRVNITGGGHATTCSFDAQAGETYAYGITTETCSVSQATPTYADSFRVRLSSYVLERIFFMLFLPFMLIPR